MPFSAAWATGAGARLRKVENLGPTQDGTTIPATAPATLYFCPVEVRGWKVAGTEQAITYCNLNTELTNGAKTFLYRVALDSVRPI